ncbi:hypothetical protein MKEN_00853500 [Mycena kentingensis (nom. inval.)]|nr:hypothetical protein MKEN_00853500 [Mycena kentingensis (nom. inval.)]
MSFVSPTKRRVPPQPYTPRHRLPSQPPRQPIWFDYAGSRPGQGIPMRELRLKGSALPMCGALDPVLGGSGLQRIVFRINWPGYGHVEWCRSVAVVAPNGAPISRMALAMQIATNYANWYEKTQFEQPSSNEWLLSPKCVEFKHLHLVSLINTFEDCWQADVALDIC